MLKKKKDKSKTQPWSWKRSQQGHCGRLPSQRAGRKQPALPLCCNLMWFARRWDTAMCMTDRFLGAGRGAHRATSCMGSDCMCCALPTRGTNGWMQGAEEGWLLAPTAVHLPCCCCVNPPASTHLSFQEGSTAFLSQARKGRMGERLGKKMQADFCLTLLLIPPNWWGYIDRVMQGTASPPKGQELHPQKHKNCAFNSV